LTISLHRVEGPLNGCGQRSDVRRYDQAGPTILDVIPYARAVGDDDQLAHRHRVEVGLPAGASLNADLERYYHDRRSPKLVDELGVRDAPSAYVCWEIRSMSCDLVGCQGDRNVERTRRPYKQLVIAHRLTAGKDAAIVGRRTVQIFVLDGVILGRKGETARVQAPGSGLKPKLVGGHYAVRDPGRVDGVNAEPADQEDQRGTAAAPGASAHHHFRPSGATGD